METGATVEVTAVVGAAELAAGDDAGGEEVSTAPEAEVATGAELVGAAAEPVATAEPVPAAELAELAESAGQFGALGGDAVSVTE